MTLVHGLTSAKQGVPLLVDSSGRAIIEPLAYVYPVFDSIIEANINTALPAGTSNVLGAAVPASQAYMWKSFTFMYLGTVAGVNVRWIVLRASVVYVIGNLTPIVSNQFYSYNLDIPMVAGDQAGARVIGATLNDDLSVYNSYLRVR
jgi:hypothetical protein